MPERPSIETLFDERTATVTQGLRTKIAVRFATYVQGMVPCPIEGHGLHRRRVVQIAELPEKQDRDDNAQILRWATHALIKVMAKIINRSSTRRWFRKTPAPDRSNRRRRSSPNSYQRSNDSPVHRLPDHDHQPKAVGATPAHLVLIWIHRVFSNLKRWALGTFHGLRRAHLRRYLDEFVFRWNRRRHTATAFDTLLGIGTRLRPADYRDIVGQRV